MKVKIFVAYHCKSDVIQNEVYTPIQVGRSISAILPEMIGDDTGDNISIKNKIYSEMTAMYWVWKNCNDLEYVGLCHYRRFYSFNKNYFTIYKKRLLYSLSKLFMWINRPGSNYIKDNAYTIDSIKELNSVNATFTERVQNEIFKYDLITLYPTKFSGMDVKTLFSTPSGVYHINVIENIISEKYPDLLKFFLLQCNSNKLYPANMCIMKKAVYNEYASFIFDVLESHERHCINDKWCFDPLVEKSFYRLSGYLSEVLTSTFVHYCKSKLSFKIKYVYQVFYNSNE